MYQNEHANSDNLILNYINTYTSSNRQVDIRTGRFIDSLVVREIPSCLPVSGLAVDSVSESTVSLSWSGEAASYTIMNGSTQVATGIGDVEDNPIGISAAGLRIVVEGAEHQDIRIYTVDGRCVRTQTDASAAEEFAMDAAGVYMVMVGNHTAKRVVVMR